MPITKHCIIPYILQILELLYYIVRVSKTIKYWIDFFSTEIEKNINQTQKSDKPRTWLLFQYGEDQ